MHTPRQLILACALALTLATGFALGSSGLSLIVTFVPGMALALLCWSLTSWRRAHDSERVLPLYLAALGWQFIHFAEEYLTGFNEAFPALIDGSPAYPLDTFVTFNMVAYCAFSLAAVALLLGRAVPMLAGWFFVAYGVVGNAIAHVVFAVVDGGYFPGLYTALGFFILGPPLVRRLFETNRPATLRSARP